jgi:hypothetical protein
LWTQSLRANDKAMDIAGAEVRPRDDDDGKAIRTQQGNTVAVTGQYSARSLFVDKKKNSLRPYFNHKIVISWALAKGFMRRGGG